MTTKEDSAAQPVRRPGGRSAVIRAAVGEATFVLLDEVGYEGLTLPEVAERAAVHKTTIYRRWPTKLDLVSDLIRDMAEANVPTPDTGSLVGDLEGLLAEVASMLRRRHVRAVLRAVMELHDDDAAARAARTAFWESRFASSGAIVARAVERGELPEGTDPRRYLELVFGPLYLRLLIVGDEMDHDDLAALARLDVSRRG